MHYFCSTLLPLLSPPLSQHGNFDISSPCNPPRANCRSNCSKLISTCLYSDNYRLNTITSSTSDACHLHWLPKSNMTQSSGTLSKTSLKVVMWYSQSRLAAVLPPTTRNGNGTLDLVAISDNSHSDASCICFSNGTSNAGVVNIRYHSRKAQMSAPIHVN